METSHQTETASSPDKTQETLEAFIQKYTPLPLPNIASLFKDNPNRFRNFSIRIGKILIDYSRTPLSKTQLTALFRLARSLDIEKKRDTLFSGGKVNYTENQAALHTALRDPSSTPITLDGINILPVIQAEREKMAHFAHNVREGIWRGYTGKKIRTIIHIGIGGSNLGPELTLEALASYGKQKPKFYFLSDVNPFHLERIFRQSSPQETLFIIASKSFRTAETLLNAQAAKQWIVEKLGQQSLKNHFVAISANKNRAIAFGIPSENIFQMWDWVGGRYSIWSSIGLPLMIAIGGKHFSNFLQGAYKVDQHFKKKPLAHNAPVILALLSLWYRNICQFSSQAILPYDNR